ncbi:aminotransferase class IV [Luteimonas sp. A501]
MSDPLAAGHFTTLQVRNGLVQGRDLHLLRLRNASREMYGGGPRKAEVRALIRRRLANAGEAGRDCTLRVQVRPVPPDTGGDDVFGPPLEFDSPDYEGGIPATQRVDVGIGPPRLVPVAPLRLRSHRGLRARPGVKHLAIGPQLDARNAAIAAGFDDALLVAEDGRIAEGTFWNIAFWDGQVLTWPLAPALPGTTVMMLRMAMAGTGVAEQRVTVMLDGIDRQRAAVALNSRGIQEIASIDGQRLPGDAGFTARLRALLAEWDWTSF